MRPFLLACLLALLAPLAALAAPPTYSGEAPVRSQSDVERGAALKTALANVVIRQAGDTGILARGDVARAVGEADRYVVQYEYVSYPALDGEQPRLALVAQFDARAVDAMLAGLGIGTATAGLAQPSEALLRVGDIRDADDFLRLAGYLSRNNFVRSFDAVSAAGDGLVLRVALTGDLAGFLRVLELERTLGSGPEVPGVVVDASLVLLH